MDYDKYGDTYRLRSEQIFNAKMPIKDYEFSANQVNVALLLSDFSIQVIDQFTG